MALFLPCAPNQDLTAFSKNIALLKVTDDPTPLIPIVTFLCIRVTPPLGCRILSFFYTLPLLCHTKWSQG